MVNLFIIFQQSSTDHEQSNLALARYPVSTWGLNNSLPRMVTIVFSFPFYILI